MNGTPDVYRLSVTPNATAIVAHGLPSTMITTRCHATVSRDMSLPAPFRRYSNGVC